MKVKIKSSPVRGEETLPPLMGGIRGGWYIFMLFMSL